MNAPMPFSLLLGLFLNVTAWARDDRFAQVPSTCAGEFVSPLEIDKNLPPDPHLLFRGPLTWYQDAQGRTWPALRDRELGDFVTPNPEASHAYLRPGDELFVFNDRRKVAAGGHVGRDPQTGKLALFEGNRLSLNARELKEAIGRGAEATLIRPLGAPELAHWRDRLTPWLRRYRSKLVPGGHKITIGGRRIEHAYFETFFEGKSAFAYENDEKNLRVWIQSPAGKIPLGPGDRLFLLDERGEVILDRRLGDGNLLDLKPDLLRAKSAAALTVPF